MVSNGEYLKKLADKRFKTINSFWRRVLRIGARESSIEEIADLYLDAASHFYNERDYDNAIYSYFDSAKLHFSINTDSITDSYLKDNGPIVVRIYERVNDILNSHILNGDTYVLNKKNDKLETIRLRLTQDLSSMNMNNKSRSLSIAIAALYETLGDYRSAIEYYHQTLFDIVDYKDNHISYFNIAKCYFYLGKIPECLKNLGIANDLVKNDRLTSEYIFCLVLIQIYVLYQTDASNILIDPDLSQANTILKQYELMPNYFKASSSYFVILQNYLTYIDNEDWEALSSLPSTEITEQCFNRAEITSILRCCIRVPEAQLC